MPPTTPARPAFDDTLVEWGGAQRWVLTAAEGAQLVAYARGLGGHALRVHGGEVVAPPLDDALLAIHRRLRESFDPHGVFVPGRPLAY